MMRISYGKIFLGTTLINVVFWIVAVFITFFDLLATEKGSWHISDAYIAFFGGLASIIPSSFNGLLAMLALRIFGKKEETVAPVKEEPKEKIVYVIKEEPKERKENKEDDTRYMPH